ncbi:MAG: lysine--tRNA ligase [Candidatus Gracilibacteria bacterium]|nr:lysine--tRNA ligase [Candidatus Gracilibacteria bacterium]
MDYSRESLDRQEKIQNLKDAGVICYANNYRGKQDIKDIIATSESQYKDVEKLMESGSQNTFQTAGRIMSSRGMGKLVFGKIRDASGDIQFCFAKDKVVFNTGKELVSSIVLAGEEKSAFKVAEKFCQVGDYIGIKGDLFLTKHGELTIFVNEFQILSKAVRPLPEKFHGLTDKESIYRQRYLDMIMDEESYKRFVMRSRFIKTLRDFYDNNSFLEVETPVLGNAASGAAAAPFITHHNDFDEQFFLRISPETFLKRVTVGRFERVVEFTRNFRNEGSDPSHIQEFSAIEHYACFWNYEDNMRFTEEMFDFIFKNMPELSKEVDVKDKMGITKRVNFQTPWQRIDYIEGIKEVCGIDVSKYVIGDEAKLLADIKSAGIQFEGMDKMVVPTLIDYLFKKVLRPSIVGPAFVYNYPKTMQPLARQNDENPSIVEQFQVVVNGWEIIKAYSELVDPAIQKSNFDAQAKAKDMGDEEATSGDDDFVLAMEYGMPCQSGWGMGIERVFSLLTEQENLRDVVLFPLMKTEKQGESKKEEV